jgi:hypothetical protein
MAAKKHFRTYLYSMRSNWTTEKVKDHADFLKVNPHYIVTYNLFDIIKSRDLSGNNPENIPPLEDGEYPQFMLDVNMAIRMGPILLSLYTDASGTEFVLDSNGNPIVNRFLKQTSYSYPYIDKDGLYIQAVLTCTFGDNSTLSVDGLHHSIFWYFIKGITDPNNLQPFT